MADRGRGAPVGVGPADLAARLRASGCVFAEDEAAILLAASADAARLESLVRRRVSGEPLEHVVGWVDFGGLRLAVGPGVFVPRQRSVHLARVACRVVSGQAKPVAAELYAGVAPLAATLAGAVPGIEIHATEVSEQALAYARRNLGESGTVHRGDGFAGLPAHLLGRVTLLVAVPPYVPTTAAGLLPREARDYEPEAALFAGVDGLDHVRAITDGARRWLAPGGGVLLEMGRAQYRPAAAYARRAGYATTRHPASDGQTVVLALRA